MKDAIYSFKKLGNGFTFVFEKALKANEEIIIKVPPVSPNKRGINDIGWQTDGEVMLYGTLSEKFAKNTALWQEIRDFDEVNKTTAALKVVCGEEPCNIVIRIIMN